MKQTLQRTEEGSGVQLKHSPSMQFALATQTQLDRQGHRQTDTRARICFYDRQNYLEVEQLADAVCLEVNQ